jgi:hypothetical protein
VAAAVLEELGVVDPERLGGEPGWWREPLPASVRSGSVLRDRGQDLLADVRWVRRYFVPWVGRRLRGVSSGDLVGAKQIELVDVVRRPDAASE